MASPSWARRAMVATSNPHAVEAALWALAQGGTAVDAAVASDAVLGVVQPMSTGIGGDAFCLVDDGREVTGFNGSGASPSALDLATCAGRWGDTSPLTVTVPGAVDAWGQLSERYGRLGLRRVLEPAIALAALGAPLGVRAVHDWHANAARLRPCSLATPVAPGSRWKNPALAGALEAVAHGGPRVHYEGRWGRAAARAAREAGGVLTEQDLSGHRGEWVKPISAGYRDHEVVELPPNGQGAAVLVALGRLEGERLGGPDDPATMVTVMGAVRDGMREAYRHVADPRLVDVPAFWKARDTVYTAVVADGMAVSLISSVFMGFGSGIWAEGAVLQNRGFGFSLDPAHPNVVAGRKRPFHTIIPAMVRSGSRTRIVFGVIGGPMQPQGQVQVLVHLLDHGLDPAAALARPRAFWLAKEAVGLEAGLPPVVAARFEAAGWEPSIDFPSDVMGVGQVVRVHDDGWLEGASDHRHDGIAAGILA